HGRRLLRHHAGTHRRLPARHRRLERTALIRKEPTMTTTKKARLGFIGAGWWATANHMPILAQRDDVELTAVCRRGRAELKQLQDRFGFQLATESAEELVNYPGLDAVVVSSPHTLHYEHARLALERGLHVMCEKPMCTQGVHARELVRLADAKG